MLNKFTLFHTPDVYTGSRALVPLSNLTGISLDLVNFLVCQLVGFFLASTFRNTLHVSKVSVTTRHLVALHVGLMVSLFCYGTQAIHILIMPTICLIMMRTLRPQVIQIWVMAMAMSYLLVIHVLRQIYTNGTDLLDVTGPLMIITQKVTNLAFNIHDGRSRNMKDLTRRQETYAVRKMPSILEYYSYVLDFHVILSGPVIFYTDYIEFIEGVNFRKYGQPIVAPQPTVAGSNRKQASSPSSQQRQQQRQQQQLDVGFDDPSPRQAIIHKCIGSVICGYIYMKYAKQYPIRRITNPNFLRETNILQKMWYIIMATTCFRFKFYHAWLMSDAICNNSGLGFSGYDEAGAPKWDLVSNINVFGFELSTNMREAISSWNLGTNQWLRYIVYDRTPPSFSTSLTFALSAVWHGFYPGYYITFATGALMVTTARKARRMFRHRFQQSIFTRLLYDFLTFLTTRFIMAYTTFPFMLLEFTGSFNMYLRLYLCLHIVALAVLYVLPIFLVEANFPDRSSIRNRVSTGKKSNSVVVENNSHDSPSNNNSQYYDYDHHGQQHQSISTISYPKRRYRQENVSSSSDITNNTTSSSSVGCSTVEQHRDTQTTTVGETIRGERKKGKTTSGGLLSLSDQDLSGGSALFLKKEIEAIKAAVQQDNMLPVMLSNGHAAK